MISKRVVDEKIARVINKMVTLGLKIHAQLLTADPNKLDVQKYKGNKLRTCYYIQNEVWYYV